MKLIRSSRVYSAHLPPAAALAEHVKEHAFTDILPTQERTAGFVPLVGRNDGELVAPFEGGYAFAVRIDRKTVPASVLKAETNRLIAQIEADTGRKPGKKERQQIKESVMPALLARAFPTTAVITGFYHEESHFLFLNTTSQRLSDIVMSLLVEAVSSVKTETIHVSGVKQGLTTRMGSWIALQEGQDGVLPDPFGDFALVDQVTMALESQRVSLKLDGLDAGHAAIKEALGRGFQVTSIRLEDGPLSLTLTHDFQLKTIDCAILEDASDISDLWLVEANYQVALIVDAMKKLCAMFAYKAEAAEA